MPSPPEESNDKQPQPPSFANLHPPSQKKQEGLGIGRESKTSPLILADDAGLATEKGKSKSKFFTDCKQEYLASINCRLENFDHKASGSCETFFDEYKACRKLENERRLEENAGKSFF